MYHTPVPQSASPGVGASLIILVGLAGVFVDGLAQDPALIPDSTIAIPALQFDSSGALVIHASSTSSQHDFDFLVGTWKLRNRKLTSRLTHSTEWISFESRVEMHQILNGLGNIDKYTDHASGKPYEGVALRLFNPATRLWSIYWADSNAGSLDPPVVGSFEGKIGHFFARDTYHGRPIIVVFRWDVRNPSLPVWSQAFSTDEGKTWEWNSINVSERVRSP
ncbi:MAG TPA: hypothetical protein VN719_11410 [Gemmatimonadales bacterium]|jgi:hypothetical protein|nr:hypothetical protein [Gemmatimonadales bacterium]